MRSRSIFLSHNHADKPVVEPIAIRLAEIFGRPSVFYDSWSIQPGDGIIDRMNEGLTSPDFVFFFMSESSIASKMVSLEWQTGLMKATKGQCKLIPIRLSHIVIPAILTQSLYIDLATQGIEATIFQIVNIVQGNSTFTPQYSGFSNLTASIHKKSDEYYVKVKASHLMEPSVKFLILTKNKINELLIEPEDKRMAMIGFHENLPINNGLKSNGIFFEPVGAPLTPQHPITFFVKKVGNAAIEVNDILHNNGNEFRAIPTSFTS